MVKEKYITRKKEINLSITNGEISSIVKKDITKSACRAYENGCLGVAGKLGEPDEELMEQAVWNLQLGISYPVEATAGTAREEHLEEGHLSVADDGMFLKEMEEVLADLKAEYPQFLFSNKIRLAEVCEKLSNDAGGGEVPSLSLCYSDRVISIELLVKHVDSVNVFDDGLMFQTRNFSKEAFLKEAREHLDAYLNPAQLPEGEKVPVILPTYALASFLVQNLDAMAFGRGTSFFNGKLGEKLFHEDFSLYVDRSPEIICNAFFDMEGSTCENDRCYLIQNGVLLRPYADKKFAKEYGYENTATAEGAYDSVPSNGAYSLNGESKGKTLKELIGDGDAIYVSMMSGGDFTNDGKFASPVQASFLYRGGKLVGKLPEFNVSGALYDIFGQDYIGISADLPYEGNHKLAVRMKAEGISPANADILD